MKYSKYDVIIIGSGLSGLYLANKLALNNNFKDGVLLITKEEIFSGSTALAQGGIVSVIPEVNKKDSFSSHIKDTIKAGCGINNINTVKLVSEHSFKVAQELIRFGVEFDKNSDNRLNFTLEGAHSCPRILHCNGDATGKTIEEALCKRLQTCENIEIRTNTMAHELLIDENNACRGLITFSNQYKSFEVVYSNNIVIATGGIGQIYKNTTNPSVSTADGIALAYRAGAQVENMEFVQFHPTALYDTKEGTMSLISESVRGEGAKLVDINGEYFAKNYHHLADLAPRDIVARAINSQMQATESNYVNLDISQIGIEKFRKRFPTITALCEEKGVDISSGLIPVVPAEHYFMGGIKTDLQAQTTIENLYAIGECASSGLHGANRLASNSLLECAVFADILSENLIKNNIGAPNKLDKKIQNTIQKYTDDSQNPSDIKYINELFKELKKVMSENVGIIRNTASLNRAKTSVQNIELKMLKEFNTASRELFELQNSLCVAKLIIKAALQRRNCLGAHYRSDYTEIDTEIKNRTLNYDKLLAGQLSN